LRDKNRNIVKDKDGYVPDKNGVWRDDDGSICRDSKGNQIGARSTKLKKDKKVGFKDENGNVIRSRNGDPIMEENEIFQSHDDHLRDKEGNLLRNKDKNMVRDKDGVLRDKYGNARDNDGNLRDPIQNFLLDSEDNFRDKDGGWRDRFGNLLKDKNGVLLADRNRFDPKKKSNDKEAAPQDSALGGKKDGKDKKINSLIEEKDSNPFDTTRVIPLNILTNPSNNDDELFSEHEAVGQKAQLSETPEKIKNHFYPDNLNASKEFNGDVDPTLIASTQGHPVKDGKKRDKSKGKGKGKKKATDDKNHPFAVPPLPKKVVKKEDKKKGGKSG
jgi:hypothetical protein